MQAIGYSRISAMKMAIGFIDVSINFIVWNLFSGGLQGEGF